MGCVVAAPRHTPLVTTAARWAGPREHGRRPRAASGTGPSGQGERCIKPATSAPPQAAT